MVETPGLKTIFDYKVGDEIRCVITSKVWEGETHLILKTLLD